MKDETRNKIKNGLIIALVILIGLFGFFGGKRVFKYTEEISALKYNKTVLETQKAFLETQVKFEQAKADKKDKVIDSCMIVFKKKDKVIAGITADLDSALAKLDGITSDSSYQFLQQIAYNYPGFLKYLFNEAQIRHIHTDYLTARSSEKIIPVLTSQITDCKFQFGVRDSIESGLKRVIRLQKQSLNTCEKINTDNDKIIRDTEKQKNKEAHRKNFWRFGTAVMTGVTIVLAVFGI